jgi:hypothetical protein
MADHLFSMAIEVFCHHKISGAFLVLDQTEVFIITAISISRRADF